MPETISNGRAVRLDTEHAVQELMTNAVARISGAIQVELRDQHVRLTGCAQTWHEKQLAQETLRSIGRSYVIRNDINVPAWENC